MVITLHFDPSCPWTWLTSRWLLRAAEHEGFDVEWGILSLAHLNRDDPDDDPVHRVGRTAHRMVLGLLEAGDHDAVGRWYAAHGDLFFRQGREPGPDLYRDAVAAAGLDPGILEATEDEGLDRVVGERTDAAVERVGDEVGSPVLTWEDVAVFGPIIDEVPDAATSGELWRHVRGLAEIGAFAELKRGRRRHPQLATS